MKELFGKKLLAMIIAFMCLMAMPAWALDLQEARVKGLVGETQAGYVARIEGGADVSALVSEINLKRRAEYDRIAAEKGQSVDVVAKLAANQIINSLPSGAKYRNANGKWVAK